MSPFNFHPPGVVFERYTNSRDLAIPEHWIVHLGYFDHGWAAAQIGNQGPRVRVLLVSDVFTPPIRSAIGEVLS